MLTRVRRVVAALVAIAALGAPAAAAYDYTIISGLSVQTIVNALRRQPLVVGYGANPDVPDADVVPLRHLIDRLDRGRIWIIVTPPRSEHVEGQLANKVANDLNRDGVVIAIGGYNFYVTTTWGGTGNGILSQAVSNQNLTMPQYVRNIIVDFARADAHAGHPTPLADQIKAAKQAATQKQGISSSTSNAGTSTGGTTAAATAPQPASTTAPAARAPASKKSSGSSTGLLIALAAVALLVLIGGGAYGRQARKRASIRRRESEDAHAKANSDLAKLGERITDLDIDQQMPNADPGGKAEYVKALDCFQGGERRLKADRDSAEFAKAVEVIAAGLKHIDEAERLFNNHGRAKDLLPADVISRLTKLAALHRSGALTDDEFSAEKKKLLS
jgi:hypothetical protein